MSITSLKIWVVIGFVTVSGAMLLVEMMKGLVDYIYYRKCVRWCSQRQLKMKMVEMEDGRYGYIGVDEEGLRLYMIPRDFGESDRSMGMRMKEFSWRDNDKKAVDENGKEIRLEYK